MISLSGDVPDRVLDKMIKTINSDAPSGTPGIFTSRSCYGKVAHFLRHNWNDDWVMYMFGEHYVVHTCLYTTNEQKVVDTFDGELGIFSYLLPAESLPLLRKIKLSTLRHKVDRFKK